MDSDKKDPKGEGIELDSPEEIQESLAKEADEILTREEKEESYEFPHETRTTDFEDPFPYDGEDDQSPMDLGVGELLDSDYILKEDPEDFMVDGIFGQELDGAEPLKSPGLKDAVLGSKSDFYEPDEPDGYPEEFPKTKGHRPVPLPRPQKAKKGVSLKSSPQDESSHEDVIRDLEEVLKDYDLTSEDEALAKSPAKKVKVETIREVSPAPEQKPRLAAKPPTPALEGGSVKTEAPTILLTERILAPAVIKGPAVKTSLRPGPHPIVRQPLTTDPIAVVSPIDSQPRENLSGYADPLGLDYDPTGIEPLIPEDTPVPLTMGSQHVPEQEPYERPSRRRVLKGYDGQVRDVTWGGNPEPLTTKRQIEPPIPEVSLPYGGRGQNQKPRSQEELAFLDDLFFFSEGSIDGEEKGLIEPIEPLAPISTQKEAEELVPEGGRGQSLTSKDKTLQGMTAQEFFTLLEEAVERAVEKAMKKKL